jgi:YHS domain-containing protein
MNTLIFILLLGGLAFLILRGGGCSSHGHAGHGGHRRRGEHDHQGPGRDDAGAGAGGQIALVPDTDPVCGMKLAPDQGYGMMHEGRALRFCSRKCLDAFEAEPALYAPDAGTTKSSRM